MLWSKDREAKRKTSRKGPRKESGRGGEGGQGKAGLVGGEGRRECEKKKEWDVRVKKVDESKVFE